MVVQMEAEAHDWVLPVMSAHLQAEKNKTLGKEGPDHFCSVYMMLLSFSHSVSNIFTLCILLKFGTCCIIPLVAVEGQGGKGSPFTLLLVSRRSCLRQGRRFIMRGIDKEGNVANFVETEQVPIHVQPPFV